jgi:4-amino-4-deoxy-L-arabinose transferase-like glycosyltransferase
VCAAVAFANAFCWSLIVPPFQVTDEPLHFAYTQQLAENHSLPTSSEATFSPEENAVVGDLRVLQVRQSPETHTISSAAEQRRLQRDLGRHLSRHGEGGVGGAYNDPPLYHLLEVIPYGLASGGSLLDQLEAMRVLSALMAAVSALFIFLFLREALPGAPWAWTVGALSAALAPLLGFMSGAVTPESMLVAVSAAIFYCLARAFRRGLTRGLAIAIGALVAVGFLTKLNFVGLVPGIAIGMILLSVRAARLGGSRAYANLAVALAIALAPACVYVLVNLISGHATLGAISTVLKARGAHGPLLSKLSYAWQLFLPRLPGMKDYFPGLLTTRDLWFNRGVGFYGWVDTAFPTWVDNLALIPAGILALLCARSLAAGRAVVRRRAGELVVYAAMGVGLLALIGLTSYIDRKEGLFADPKYLLPALPILAAAVALAARGAGRRCGPAVGAAILVLFLAHDIFSQLLVVGRYYG